MRHSLALFLTFCSAIPIVAMASYNASIIDMNIEQTFREDTNLYELIIYTIVIKNTGDTKLYQISVDVALPAKWVYLQSNFRYEEDGATQGTIFKKKSDEAQLGVPEGSL
jgi:uncharacterized repeat protein (TIGR01451 family)